jgi:ATP-dependent Clp protease ATP-binding subunit ClpC
MAGSEIDKMTKIEEFLTERIVGQEKAITKVSAAVKRAKVGISDPNRPTGTFLFTGPTGVGKTELTKKLAEFLFNNENSMIRVDMSELMESHSVSKLLGSPPGYVGHEEGGSLTEQVRNNPYSIVLFDEIEKAHGDIFNILLQILDDGKLTDSKGRIVNFKNTIIILTSNIGERFIEQMNSIGFSAGQKEKNKINYDEIKKSTMNSLQEHFKPEFLNRLDEIVLFEALKEKDLEKIMSIELKKIKLRLKDKKIDFKISQKAIDNLINKDYPSMYGARPIKRIIQEKILDKLSGIILKNYNEAGIFSVDFKNNELVFNFKVKAVIKKRSKKISSNLVKKATKVNV